MKRLGTYLCGAMLCGVILCGAGRLWADEPAEESSTGSAEACTLELFDGKTLDGWHALGCDAAVQDGAIVFKGGDGYLRSNHRYRDFVLRLECRRLRDSESKSDSQPESGIFFRSGPPPEGKPWPDQHEIALARGHEGDLVGLVQVGKDAHFRLDQWNDLVLTAKGMKASLSINGHEAWSTDRLATPLGYIGLKSRDGSNGSYAFRNIRITELGSRWLFNGRDLTGWEGAGAPAEKCWDVEMGMLRCSGKPGPWLRTRDQFGDFDLRLEYKLRPGGNSGVYVRVPEDGNHHGAGAGVEVQILDDADPRYKDLHDYQYAGSVYDIAPAQKHVARPTGQWNTLEIECTGPCYRVEHNGVVVVEATLDDFPALEERRLNGFLGLQNHSEEVWFRNIRISAPQP